MRRHLDEEMQNLKLTRESLEKIHQKIRGEYNIDLKKGEDEEVFEQIYRKIFACFSKESNHMKRHKMNYIVSNNDEIVFHVTLSEHSLVKADIIDRDKIEKDIVDMDEKNIDIISLYSKLMETDSKEKIEAMRKEYIEMSFDEWKQQLNYMIAYYGIFSLDCRIECLLRLKYSQISDERYNFNDGRSGNMFNVIDRLLQPDYSPMKNLDSLPVFTKELQDVLFTQRYIRMFEFGAFKSEEKRKSEDITRYGYEYVKELYQKLENSSLENLYYLDNMLGISLTNVIVNSILEGKPFVEHEGEYAKIPTEIFEGNFLDIVRVVSKIKGVYGRNYIAYMVFHFLFNSELNKDKISQVKKYIEKQVKFYNKCYMDLCEVFVWLYISDLTQQTVEYKNEVIKEEEDELKNSVKGKIVDETIERILEESGNSKKSDKILNSYAPKKPSTLYARIHKHVMEGIWD